MGKLITSLIMVFLIVLATSPGADLTAAWDLSLDINNYTEAVTTEPAAGHIIAWGDNSHSECCALEGRDFVAIAAGGAHSLVLRADGTLVAWGDNTYCECEVPDGNDFVAISAGYSHSLALKNNGTLEAWGWNFHEQCNVPASRAYDFIAIAAGGGHNIALTSKICTSPISYDFDGDCRVNFTDFAIFCSSWLQCNLDPPEACWQ